MDNPELGRQDRVNNITAKQLRAKAGKTTMVAMDDNAHYVYLFVNDIHGFGYGDFLRPEDFAKKPVFLTGVDRIGGGTADVRSMGADWEETKLTVAAPNGGLWVYREVYYGS